MTQTDKQAHTPGPWGYYGNPNDEPWLPKQGALEAGAGVSIGSVTHTEPIARFSGYLMDAVANAKRTAAAVNACEGMSTEALEANVVSDLLDALTGILRLLSTVEVLGEWEAEDSHYKSRITERAKVDAAVDDARDALAKAKG